MMSNEKKTVSFRKILVSVTAAVGLVAIAVTVPGLLYL